jgi:hypothetical protein
MPDFLQILFPLTGDICLLHVNLGPNFRPKQPEEEEQEIVKFHITNNSSSTPEPHLSENLTKILSNFHITKQFFFHNKNPSLGKSDKNSVKLPHSQEKPHLSKNLTFLPYSTKAQISQNSEQKSPISSPLSIREREREHRKKSFEQQVVSASLKNSESKNPSPETQNTQKDFSKWQPNTKNVKQSRQCAMSSAFEQNPQSFSSSLLLRIIMMFVPMQNVDRGGG